MLPLSPYVPKTQQPAPPQIANTAKPLEDFDGIDYDWMVRFCFAVIVAPKLLLIFQMLIQSMRYGDKLGFSNTSSLLSTSASVVVQSFLFFVLLQFIQRDRSPKRVLIIFLASTIFLAMLFGVSV